MRKPSIRPDVPVVVVNSGGRQPFQHGGVFGVVPRGRSVWPYEVAERLERKYASRGISIAHGEAPPVSVAEPDIKEEIRALAEADALAECEAETAQESPEPPADADALEVEPEPPAEPQEEESV